MFIRFFKVNQSASYIVLPLLAVLLWLGSWITPLAAVPHAAMPFYTMFESINYFPVVSEILALVMVLLQAFYLNHLLNKHDLRESRERNNFLTALFCILFLSFFPSFRTLLPQHLSALFLLLMVDRLFDSYRKEKAFSNCFDAGLFAAIASLFYFPAVIFLLLVYAGLIILRPFIWREWVIAFSGFVIPWLMVFTYFFWFNRLGIFFSDELGSFFSSPYFEYGKPEHAILILAFIGMFSIPAGLNFLKMLTGGKVKTNKFFLLFTWFLFLAILSGFVFPVASYSHFSLAALPLSVIFSMWFFSLKKSWIAESLFIILLGAFVYAEVMLLF